MANQDQPRAYSQRILDGVLDEVLGEVAAVAIEGAKGVGKTATALQRANSVYELDLPNVLAAVKRDASFAVTDEPPILFDEWQRLPELWDRVRRAVDNGAAPATFLMTGSASPVDLGTHSGAGRILQLRMRPLTLFERRLAQPVVSLKSVVEGALPVVKGSTAIRIDTYAEEICRSGFPGIRGLSESNRNRQLDAYVSRVVDRDFADVGRVIRDPEALRRWMGAYAAATSTTTSFDQIRDAATPGEDSKPSKRTGANYREILERLWILDPVPAWLPQRNHFSRLAQRAKHHLVDPAITARLLGVGEESLMRGQLIETGIGGVAEMFGPLFESLVTLDVRTFADAIQCRTHHFRTQGGEHEVDLIVVRPDQRVVAVEVKLSSTVDERDVRHLLWLKEKLGGQLIDMILVNSGQFAYRRDDGIIVVPAALLGP